MSKIFESIVKTQLLEFLDKHIKLYSKQFGFRVGMGTSTAVSAGIGAVISGGSNLARITG